MSTFDFIASLLKMVSALAVAWTDRIMTGTLAINRHAPH